MKKISLYLAIIFLTCGSFLFSPCWDVYTPEGNRSGCIPLNNHMRVFISSDSYSFLSAAIEPRYLFQQNNYRQSRPLFAIAGTVVGYGTYYLTYPAHKKIDIYLKNKKGINSNYNSSQLEKGTYYFCFYIGFIIINILTLLACLLLFEKILTALSGSWKNGRALFLMILVMLISNHVTKIFFWSVHQQLFNILTPLLCLYLGIHILKKVIPLKKLMLISFGLGLLLLVYGNFLLTLPVLIAGYLYATKKREVRLGYVHLLNSMLLIFFFFLPTLAWIVCLKSMGITLYNPELIEYREFIWIFDKINDPFHSLLPAFWQNTVDFLKTAGSLFVPFVLLAIVLIMKKSTLQSGVFRNTSGHLPGSATLILFVLFETIIFYWLLGYYADRLTSSLTPILLIIFALIVNTQKLDKRSTWFLLILLISFHLYNVFIEPVYFSRTLFLH